MKYIKTLAFVLGAFALASCGETEDKPSYNTNAGVTVSMAKDELLVKENRGIVSVPMIVTGETNGYVTVECEVKEYGPVVAMEDVHYLLTSKSHTFDVGATEGAFELKLVDDEEINDPREFVITLTSVQGAELGTPVSTIVVIRDNDSEPYDRISGEWKVPSYGWNSGTLTYPTIKIMTPEEDDPNYGHIYDVYGIVDNEIPVRMDFSVNEITQIATLTLNYDQPFTYKGYDGLLCYVSDDGYIVDSGVVTLQWSAEEPGEIVFVSGPQQTYFDLITVYNNDGWRILNAMQGITKLTK